MKNRVSKVSVTIKDIAKVAGVAHSTVSRALNDSKSISDETKVRIRDIANELGYTPNVSARSLVLDRSYNIGLFFLPPWIKVQRYPFFMMW